MPKLPQANDAWLRRLHPMSSFGVVRDPLPSIRADRLENRLRPRVPFPHKHDFYHIVLVTRGGGWHEIDFLRHPANAGSLFVMKPAQVHAWHFAPNTRGYVLEFQLDAAFAGAATRKRMQTLLHSIPDAVFLKERVKQEITFLSESMASEYSAPLAHSGLFLRSSLTLLLLHLSRHAPAASGRAAPRNSLLERFETELCQNYRKQHAVAFYASRLNLSAKALTMRLSRAGAPAPRALIQARCLLEAKRLLAYSDRTVAAIGEELGFSDANYFTRLFRRKEGVSPAAFRKRARHLC